MDDTQLLVVQKDTNGNLPLDLNKGIWNE